MAKQNKQGAEKGRAKAQKKGAGKKSKAVQVVAAPADYVPRLKSKYHEEVIPFLKEKFQFKNVNEIPQLVKVKINVGIGDAHGDQRLLDSVVEEIQIISGQKPIVTRARKSISNFKLREGMQVGVAVTLRRFRMWEFLDLLFSLAIPRVRDFRGLSDKSFDGRGNYSFGVKEQIVFPMIDYDRVVKIHGMDITLVTTAKNDEEGYELLKALGCPFRKRQPVTSESAA